MDSSVIAVGIIETFACNGKSRSTGDGKPATKAGMPLPVGVAIDPQNQSLYYTESGSDRVRRVELATGIISHGAGLGETCYGCDGGPAGEAGESPLIAKSLVVLSGDAIGIDFSDDHGWLRPACSPDGVDMGVYRDDGKPGAEVRFHDPVAITVDAHDDVYVADKGSNRIRKIDMKTGTVTTVAGVCFYGYDGDGKPATQAMLNAPEAVLFDSTGHMYISDAMNHRVRRVEAGTGIITTV